MGKNNLLKIKKFGQSIWLDYIDRRMIHSGELKRLIEADGLRGVTSNPSIFDEAIERSQDYEEAILALSQEGKTAEEIYQTLTVEDVQMAADEFRHLYDTSGGTHGFVSLEVNPHLAYRTAETMAEARELWRSLDRSNVFIKVPATKEGLPAIQQLISEGINVNVTLLFGLPRYREVAAAYIAGLEERAAAGKPCDRVCSVASFFLSRIDVLVDAKLEEIMAGGGPKAETAEKLRGQVAIASAKEAYQMYKEIFGQKRFQRLAEKGGRRQRVLWASTSTKNPDYSDVKYVEALIGPETINTLPQETLKAYRDHGNPQERLERGLEEARKVLELLPEVNMDIDQVTQQLEKEGVEKFNKPYDRLLDTLAKKRSQVLGKKSQPQKAAPDG
jgi:transaldolase